MTLIKINISIYLMLLFTCVACNDMPKTGNNTTLAEVDTTLKWVDFRTGELPPADYYDAIDSIVRKWGIRYERIEGGCEATDGEKESYEKHNYKYFAVLVQKYGKGWKQKFDAEVAALDSILLVKKKEVGNSVNKTPSVKCIDKGGDMENGFTEECTYLTSTLADAYKLYRLKNFKNDDGKYLEPTMPEKAHQAGFDGYPLSVVYQYPQFDILHVVINFPGGITYITFKQDGDAVKVTTVHSPD